MATFELVHGQSRGGWCWKKLTPLLRAAGHEVYAPTLTGLGERAHLATPDVGLETHVLDVVNVLNYEDLRGVVLVGHSLGGMVITGVASDAADRLAHLVYLDAIVPQHGQSRLDLFEPGRREATEVRHRDRYDAALRRLAGDSGTEPIHRSLAPAVGDQWARDRHVAHPIKAMQEPVRVYNPTAALLPRTFIWCTQTPPGDDVSGNRAASIQRARTEPGWRFRELATTHMAMLTAPQELAALLREIV